MEKVVVVIPIHDENPSYLDLICFEQCFKILGSHPIKVLSPKGLKLDAYKKIIPVFETVFIHPIWQSSYVFYNRLKASKIFYHLFKSYEFILVHELDAFVFRDELLSWCEKGYDYIGAPLFEGYIETEFKSEIKWVGNGGLSLRKVSTHLKVLNSFAYLIPPQVRWRERMDEKPKGLKLISTFAGFLLDISIRNNTFWVFNNARINEDQFWCLHVAKNFKWYKVAPVGEAIAFSFEMQPIRLFKLNQNRLPFGCHKWWKYGFDFWAPHIQKFDYDILKPSEGVNNETL